MSARTGQMFLDEYDWSFILLLLIPLCILRVRRLIVIFLFCFSFLAGWYILPRPRRPRARGRFVFAQPKFLEDIFTSIVNLEQHARMTSTSSRTTLTSTQLSMNSAPLATLIGHCMPVHPKSTTTLRRRWALFYRVISRHPHQHFRPSHHHITTPPNTRNT